MHSSRTYRDGRRLITTASAVYCGMLSERSTSGERRDGFPAASAAMPPRPAEGGDLVGNPANAQHEALTVDCDLHHTGLGLGADHHRYASGVDTDRPEDHDDARRDPEDRLAVFSQRRPARLVINSRHNPRYR